MMVGIVGMVGNVGMVERRDCQILAPKKHVKLEGRKIQNNQLSLWKEARG